MLDLTPSRIVLGFFVGVLGGVAVASDHAVGPSLPRLFVLAGVVLALFGSPKIAPFGRRLSLFFVAVGFVLVGAALGIMRAQSAREALSHASVTRFAGQPVVLLGIVSQYPDRQVDGIRFPVDVRAVRVEHAADAVLEPASGRVLIFADRAANVAYGDRVAVLGKLQLPVSRGSFDYAASLAHDGIVATLRARDIGTEGNNGTASGRFFAGTRVALEESTLRIVPFREGAILKALLLGDEGSMTDDFKEALNRSGLRHIVAVSGTNITIIVTVVFSAALSMGAWRHHALIAAFVIIAFFVALIGAPSTAVRAAVMGFALRAGPMLGRRSSGFRAAVAAAAGMTLLSPFILRFDIGFQLSFLAVFGIIVLSPMFLRWFRNIPKACAHALAMTCAAQLAVVPLLLSSFGRVSLVAPLTNLIVVPLLPLVTMWGFAAALLGMLSQQFGVLAALPLLPYLSLLVLIAEQAARLPVASATISGAVAAGFAFLWYGALGWLAWREAKRTPRPVDLLNENL